MILTPLGEDQDSRHDSKAYSHQQEMRPKSRFAPLPTHEMIEGIEDRAVNDEQNSYSRQNKR